MSGAVLCVAAGQFKGAIRPLWVHLTYLAGMKNMNCIMAHSYPRVSAPRQAWVSRRKVRLRDVGNTGDI